MLNITTAPPLASIGGLVLQRLGRIAVVGDTVTLVTTHQANHPDNPNSDNKITIETTITINVVKTEGLRIRQVKLDIITTREE